MCTVNTMSTHAVDDEIVQSVLDSLPPDQRSAIVTWSARETNGAPLAAFLVTYLLCTIRIAGGLTWKQTAQALGVANSELTAARTMGELDAACLERLARLAVLVECVHTHWIRDTQLLLTIARPGGSILARLYAGADPRTLIDEALTMPAPLIFAEPAVLPDAASTRPSANDARKNRAD